MLGRLRSFMSRFTNDSVPKIKPPSTSDVENLTFSELMGNIRDFKIQLTVQTSLPVAEQDLQVIFMLKQAVEWNTQALLMKDPSLTRKKIETESNIPPTPPKLEPEPFVFYKLQLNIPRTIVEFDIIRHKKVFKLTDVSSFFSHFIYLSNLNLIFVTAPLFEKYSTPETLVPSGNVTKKRVSIGKVDTFPPNRSFTIVADDLKRVGDKLFIPLGIAYSVGIEEDQLYSILPTRVEIISQGKTINPYEMTVLSNGLIYVDLDSSISISEIHIVYGKPQPQAEDSIIKFGETQTDHTGSVSPLEGDAPFSEAENTFRNTLMYNKPQRTTAVPNKYTGSKLTQIETLNRILTYLQNTFLRYSVLDTLNEPGVTDNARRALRGMRTSCLGAANVAKHIIDTNKFTPNSDTRSGILCGFNVGSIVSSEQDVTLDRNHAITLVEREGRYRVYDITPRIEYREPQQEKYIQDFIKNTNQVYRYIKNLFLDRNSFRQYQDLYRENFRLLQSFNIVKGKNDSSMSHFFSRISSIFPYRQFKESINLNINLDEFDLRFPFSLNRTFVDIKKTIRTIGLIFKGFSSNSAINTSDNKSLLRRCGLQFVESISNSITLPVSNRALEILRDCMVLKENNHDLISELISFQRSLNQELLWLKDLRNRTFAFNLLLLNFLKSKGIEVNESEFQKIDWVSIVLEADPRHSSNFNSLLEYPKSMEELKEYFQEILSSVEIDFQNFIDDNSNQILRIFTEKNSETSRRREIRVSSTFLWRENSPSSATLVNPRPDNYVSYKVVNHDLLKLCKRYKKHNN